MKFTFRTLISVLILALVVGVMQLVTNYTEKQYKEAVRISEEREERERLRPKARPRPVVVIDTIDEPAKSTLGTINTQPKRTTQTQQKKTSSSTKK
ncbi:hypothetical protein Dip518_000041 [Parelusimicrobium proximum]|uniref:hypothetical protein n=1 Tax=Parelusimicrobium proximum TaxID=3228953 RepID=UPI003D181CD1